MNLCIDRNQQEICDEETSMETNAQLESEDDDNISQLLSRRYKQTAYR